MNPEYDFKSVEAKWQNFWESNKTFKADDFSEKPKYYCLDMFPYPSGAGLHVGHPEGYTATDIYCRFLRMNGYNVLHPMGFDSFGLPAENYAIKTGTHPYYPKVQVYLPLSLYRYFLLLKGHILDVVIFPLFLPDQN